MGTKQAGRRKYFFLYLACGLTLFIVQSACRSFTATRPDEKATISGHAPSSAGGLTPGIPDTIVSPTVSDENTSQHLDAAYLALAEGNYTTAASEIEMASTQGPPAIRPETIYLKGLLYADAENPAGNRNKAYETLHQIEKEHPDSHRVGEVRILTGLLHELQSIQTENQRLLKENSQLKKKLVAEQNSVQRLKSLMKKMKEIDLGIVPEEQ